MEKVLVNFLLDLNDKGLINNHDFDYEKVAQDFSSKNNVVCCGVLEKMKYFIKYLERKIESCDELGGLEREKAVYQSTLKEYRKAINVIHCCTILVCVDDNDLPNITQDNEYKIIVETNRHYNIIDDNGNDVLVSKKYFRQLKKAK